MYEIGKNLKRIRLLKNLPLKEVGLLLNMAATAISEYEIAEIISNSKKIIDFANYLLNYIKNDNLSIPNIKYILIVN